MLRSSVTLGGVANGVLLFISATPGDGSADAVIRLAGTVSFAFGDITA